MVPFVVARRFPFLAAASSAFLTFVLLGTQEAPLTVTALGILLYAIGHLVARRGLLIAAPVILPFLVHAMAPVGGGNAGPGERRAPRARHRGRGHRRIDP